MAEAKNPTVDDLEKKEQELFRTGPLSVLTTSVKSNSQVLINCRSDALLRCISLHVSLGQMFGNMRCTVRRFMHCLLQVDPLRQAAAIDHHSMFRDSLMILCYVCCDHCRGTVALELIVYLRLPASTCVVSQQELIVYLRCFKTGTTESFWRASKPSTDIAT